MHHTISPEVQEMIAKHQNGGIQKKKLTQKMKENKKITSSSEYIDNYIYTMENGLVLDGLVDWSGRCTIDKSWEDYKESVGYYKRHPEREKESRAFTKNIMDWWKKVSEQKEIP